jgi:hypothetical protein
MGLDQYAYVAAKEGQYDEYYEKGTWNKETQEYDSPVEKPRELTYWRKHPNLQGWMENLWRNRLADQGKEPLRESAFGSSFNGIELELTWEDLEQLEKDITTAHLPKTTGFFFGEDSDNYYLKQDLEFIKQARSEIFCGLRVFYNSSW